MNAAISVKKLYKYFGENCVLDGVDLEVNQGEFAGLVGVNGAGKTTLIKCLLDLCNIAAGQIRIFGAPNDDTRARENLIFLPEHFTPPYYLTGRNFLMYMAELQGIDYSEEREKRLLDVLNFDVDALLKPVKSFSKGMSRKIGLAACLMSGKDLMIFDEPMSGLDLKARVRLRQYLLRLKEQGKTALFSTHLLADVENLCDRIAILHHGHIFFHGTIGECLRTFSASDLEQAYLNCIQ